MTGTTDKTDKTLKRDLLWNTLGSLVYAAAAAVLAFLVMRMAGSEDGGIFGFGYSTFGQQMFIIAYFGVRPFHITDVTGEYRFDEYRKARLITTGIAVGAAAVYSCILAVSGSYTVRKALIITVISGIKIADGYADVYECECQRAGVLWRGGRELCIRTVLMTGVFLTVLALTGNLPAAGLAAVLVQAAVIYVFRKRLAKDGILSDSPAVRREAGSGSGTKESGSGTKGSGSGTKGSAGDAERPGAYKKLLASAFLLFLSVFLDFYVFSGAKYAIDMKMDDAASGIFNILFMPTSVIYMLANFIIKPFMTRMAKSHADGDTVGFAGTRRRIAAIILALTAAACLAAAFLGKWALGVFEWILGEAYTGQLTGYIGEFFLIILGGGLYALASLYYYVLVIRRQQKAIFFVYLAAAVITLPASLLLVGAFGLTGAAVVYAAMMSVLVCGMKICDLIRA